MLKLLFRKNKRKLTVELYKNSLTTPRAQRSMLRLCCKKCFQVLDTAAMEFSLKIKEAIRIKRENPSLNSQVKHVNLKMFL